MKGQYFGFYKYDRERIQRILSRDQTFFEIDITEVDGDRFYGVVRDETVGQAGTGTITGKLNGDRIFFIKQMPTASSITADGGHKTFNTKHPKIYYEGIKSDGKFKGTWKIKFSIIFVGFFPVLVAKTTGTWEMREK